MAIQDQKWPQCNALGIEDNKEKKSLSILAVVLSQSRINALDRPNLPLLTQQRNYSRPQLHHELYNTTIVHHALHSECNTAYNAVCLLLQLRLSMMPKYVLFMSWLKYESQWIQCDYFNLGTFNFRVSNFVIILSNLFKKPSKLGIMNRPQLSEILIGQNLLQTIFQQN